MFFDKDYKTNLFHENQEKFFAKSGKEERVRYKRVRGREGEKERERKR